MRLAVLVGAALILSGCSAEVQPTASTAAPTHAPLKPTPTLIPMDDMMGMYPQQTVFVATSDHVSAITLLNHFTRYQIPTNGAAQVAVDRAGMQVYILDGGHDYRLRALDVASGGEHAVQEAIDDVAKEHGVLSIGPDHRVLVLKADAQRAWVDAYAASDLQALGSVTEKPGCADQLLTSANRVAVLCRSSGEILFDDLHGSHVPVDGGLQNVVAAAMADDGALYLATANHRLASVATGSNKLVEIPWPTAWTGRVLPDSLALAQGGADVVIGQQSDDGVWLRVFARGDALHGKSIWLTGQPIGGNIVALWPFAYFTVERTIRHVELSSGLLEIMAEVGANAMPAAVVNG